MTEVTKSNYYSLINILKELLLEIERIKFKKKN